MSNPQFLAEDTVLARDDAVVIREKGEDDVLDATQAQCSCRFL